MFHFVKLRITNKLMLTSQYSNDLEILLFIENANVALVLQGQSLHMVSEILVSCLGLEFTMLDTKL